MSHYIEGQTPLDEEEKRDLIPIVLIRQDLDRFEQQNILEARKWIMKKSAIARYDIHAEKFLLQLHTRMFKHVWKWAGNYRKSNKNIGVEFFLIPIEVKKLLQDLTFWLENNTYSLEDLPVVVHHRLVKIHLFPNGNGRHARLYADIMTLKYGQPPLTWGGKVNLNEPNKIRTQYIQALREADYGNYQPLLTFSRN